MAPFFLIRAVRRKSGAITTLIFLNAQTATGTDGIHIFREKLAGQCVRRFSRIAGGGAAE
jgi:hypothetical protein